MLPSPVDCDGGLDNGDGDGDGGDGDGGDGDGGDGDGDGDDDILSRDLLWALWRSYVRSLHEELDTHHKPLGSTDKT